MSGHSKWSTIKHKKGAADAKRGKIFTKLIREITTAARLGGEDPGSNPRLRAAITVGKQNNMPADNIKRAIAKGAGNDKDSNYDEIIYEGYGPNQVAVIVECLTDNKNRTVASIRSRFNKGGGSMGSSNSVMYAFDRKGIIEVGKASIDEDSLTEHILEGGAEDIDSSGPDNYQITTEAADLHQVQSYLEEQGVEIVSSNLAYLPQNLLEITDLAEAQQVMNFLDSMEDDDDVQRIHSNFDMTDEIAEQLAAEG